MPDNLPLLDELRRRADLLDYGVETGVTDDMGRRWRYHTYPIRRGGPHHYFLTKRALLAYIEMVEEVQAPAGEP